MLQSMLRRLKPFIERFPTLAFTYRTLRHTQNFHRQHPKLTPYGFKLAGNKEMQDGSFEQDEVELVMELLNDTEVFVDIGANIGLYSCLARSLGKKVIAIEPLKENLDYLYANFEANGWSDIEIFPIGLSAKPGIATLWGGGTGASLIKNWAGASSLMWRKVSVNTLDRILSNQFEKKRLLVKLDVEGAELEILRGASLTLSLSDRKSVV